MALSDTAARVAPIAQLVLYDDDLRDHVRRAARAGRSAVRKPAPKPTRLRRAGEALREAGEVMSTFRRRAEQQRRAERRSAFLKATAIAGGLAAAAGAVVYGKSTTRTEPARV